MRLAPTESCQTLHRTKTLGRGAGKAGIPRDRVVYTELSRSLEGERGGVGGQGGSEEDGSDSKQCRKDRGKRGMRREESEEKMAKGSREEGDGEMSQVSVRTDRVEMHCLWVTKQP